MKNFWFNYRSHIISVAAALAVGGLAELISGGSMDMYDILIKPPLSPRAWLFPVVWSLLYILTGIAAAIVWESRHPERDTAITVYTVQLAVNFFWPIFYFVFGARLLSFFWILLLIALVFITIKQFSAISADSAWLLLPYFLWLIFAACLNLATYILNA